MSSLKYTQVLDYALKIAAEVKRKEPNTFLSLPAILSLLNYKISFSETAEMAEYLETRGFVKTIYSLGEVFIHITSSGIIYIEELGEEFSNAFTAYLATTSKDKSDLTLKVLKKRDKNPKEKIFNLIQETQKSIKDSDGANNDYIKDLDIVKKELEKLNPDFRIVEIKLNNLDNISFIAEKIMELKNYIMYAK